MNTGFQYKRRRYESWTFQKECSGLIPSFNVVEARGVEPLSENQFLKFSPGAVNPFQFPHDTPIDRLAAMAAPKP